MTDIVQNGGADGERERLAAEANEVQQDIVRGIKAVHSAWLFVAAKAYRFMEGRMWERLGFESQNEWLASPEVEQARSHMMAITRVYRELVVDRGVPVEQLQGVSIRKLEIGLPAIEKGDPWPDVVADARTLTRPDMEKRYRQPGGTRAPLNAAAEPDCQSCPMCGSWVEKDKIPVEERAS